MRMSTSSLLEGPTIPIAEVKWSAPASAIAETAPTASLSSRRSLLLLGVAMTEIDAPTKLIEGQVCRHTNPDGSVGGWVAETATVAATAFVGPHALVLDEAWVSNTARVFGKARIRDKARIPGDVQILGRVQVFGEVWLNGKARISGEARFSSFG